MIPVGNGIFHGDSPTIRSEFEIAGSLTPMREERRDHPWPHFSSFLALPVRISNNKSASKRVKFVY